MHPLLKRQLRKHLGGDIQPEIEALLDAVSRSYEADDADRELLERSLELTSKEMLQLNEDLRRRMDDVQASETHKAAILEAALDCIIVMDSDGTVQEFNPAAEQTFGYSRDEAVGRTLSELVIPPAFRDAHRRGLRHFLATGEGPVLRRRIELEAMRKDGSTFPVEVAITPFGDPERPMFAGHLRDITERRAAEAALKASEERHRLIVETATEAIVVLDADENVTFCNRVLSELLQRSTEDIVGTSVYDVVVDEDAPMMKRSLSGVRLTGRLRRDFRLRREDGMELWALASGSPILDPEGNATGTLLMFADVTERKQRERQLADANARLRAVDKERISFLNTAAHELSTPLTPLKLQVRLVGDRVRASHGEEAHSFEILERNIERLAHLVHDLLDAARLQSPELRLEPKDIDMATEAKVAADAYEDIAARAGVDVKVGRLPAMPVRCDPARLSQVFDNLLSNAVKFTPKGGRVRVEGAHAGRHCRVSIADTGPGIPADKVALLGKPFVQVHDVTDTARSGSGLGLFIARGIIERAGGTLEYAPGPKGGTVFTVVLPARDT